MKSAFLVRKACALRMTAYRLTLGEENNMCYSFQIVQFASFAAAQKVSSGNYRTSRTEAQSRPALRAFLVEISLWHTGDFSTVRILDCERLTNPIFSGTTTAAYWPSAASISIYEFLMKSRHDVLTSALS